VIAGKPYDRVGRDHESWYPAAVDLTDWFTNSSREDDNAPRSDAGWVRREINCTAGQ